MSSFLLALLMGMSAPLTSTCRSLPVTDVKALRALEFLGSIAGSYESPNCQFTLEVCTADTTDPTLTTIVGHILVKDKTGREMYMPIDFQTADVERTKYSILNGRRVFHYEYRDTNPDPEGGKKERYLFEAVKTDDLKVLEYIEFGVLTGTNKRIHWAVCRFNPER